MPQIDNAIYDAMFAYEFRQILSREGVSEPVPNYDLQAMTRRANEVDRAHFIEERMKANAVRDPTAHPRSRLPHYVTATLAWIRTSCERDQLPDWLILLVVQQVQTQLLAGTFPSVISE